MNATSTNQLDALLRQMASLADANRLRLLRLLERHELGVAELCDIVQLPQSTVSRHLKLLSDEGWVVSRRSGTTNLYRMILDELDEPARQLWLVARKQTDDWATHHQDQVRLIEHLRRRRGASRSFFAGVASQWADTRDQLYGQAFLRDALIALLPEQWTIADLGCGTGELTRDLAASVGHVIGVDNSPEMLAAARAQTESLSNVELREGELESLPIEAERCDAALLILVLTYVPDPAAVLNEMHRVLKPGGKAVVVDLMRHDRDDFRRQLGQQSMGFTIDELQTRLTDVGFTRARCRPLRPDPKAKGPALVSATAMRPGS